MTGENGISKKKKFNPTMTTGVQEKGVLSPRVVEQWREMERNGEKLGGESERKKEEGVGGL